MIEAITISGVKYELDDMTKKYVIKKDWQARSVPSKTCP